MAANFQSESAALEAIGSALVAELPKGWRKAWLYVEGRETSISVACWTAGDRQQKPAFVRLPVAFSVKLMELRETMFAGGELWTTMTYIVDADGHFDVDFGYEPVPIEGEFERRLAWEAKYFGN